MTGEGERVGKRKLKKERDLRKQADLTTLVEIEPTTRNWTEKKNIPTKIQKPHHSATVKYACTNCKYYLHTPFRIFVSLQKLHFTNLLHIIIGKENFLCDTPSSTKFNIDYLEL